MTTKKEALVVESWNVKVGRRYYSFDFKFWRGKKLIAEGNYDSSHSRSPHTMRKYLTTGYATDLVLQRYI